MEKPKLEKRICELCGKEFQPHNKNQVICSEDHYVSCPMRGKIFLRSKTSPYCSKECSNEKRKQTNLVKYGVSANFNNPEKQEEIALKRKQTCVERYGVEHPMQNTEIIKKTKQTIMDRYGVDSVQKSKEIREKTYQTNLERYGVEHPAQNKSIKEKTCKTCNERYGVNAPNQVKEIREQQIQTFLSHYGKEENPNGCDILTSKRKETCLEKYGEICYSKTEQFHQDFVQHSLKKYGTKNPMQNEDVKQKLKDTNLERYGAENPMQNEEIQKKVAKTVQSRYGVSSIFKLDETRQKTNLEKYGVPWYCMTKECKYLNGRTISNFNYKLQEELNKNGIETELEFRIENRYYDFHIKNTNILLELNPTITHTTAFNIYNSSLTGKSKDYHLVKTKLATDNGYRCIHIWDWDDTQKIINTLQLKTIIYARKCKIDKVALEDASKFLNNYHFQGSCRNQFVIYGLYFNDELVSVMSFGKPRYNKNYDWELLRYCTKGDVCVIGGASKLFQAFLQNYDGTVISYCDMSKFEGNLYTTLGFTLQAISNPTKHWSKKSNHITDNLLRQRGYDQLFGTDYGKGTSNEELMLQNKWLPVYDCGQATYVYAKEEKTNGR